MADPAATTVPDGPDSPAAARTGGRRPHVVIVGGGFGGLYAAQALKRAPVDITLLDRRNHHLFQPLLYQVAAAVLSAGDIAYPIRAILRRQKNVRVILAEVVDVDLDARQLRLGDGGRVGYDFLVLATGSSHAYFGHDEWAPFAPGLKTLEDALEIRRRILLAYERAERCGDPAERQALLSFVVVGAGPTGVELAGALAEISRQVLVSDFRSIDPREAKILLVEAGPRILPTFPESLAAKAVESLEKLGVVVRTKSPVTEVTRESVSIGAERILAGTILWCAGVRASPLGRTLGVPVDRAGRVPVGADLTVPGRPQVFVVGDLAAVERPDGGMVPGLAPAALQEGRHAARNIVRALAGKPHEPFRYRDKGNLATIGRAAAIADFGRIRLSGLAAWILWLVVHIFFLIGFRNRLIVLIEWAWAYFASQRGARLITGALESPTRPTERETQRRDEKRMEACG